MAGVTKTLWVDFIKDPFDRKHSYEVKRTLGTLVHNPGEFLTKSDVKSLIERGYKIYVDKHK